MKIKKIFILSFLTLLISNESYADCAQAPRGGTVCVNSRMKSINFDENDIKNYAISKIKYCNIIKMFYGFEQLDYFDCKYNKKLAESTPIDFKPTSKKVKIFANVYYEAVISVFDKNWKANDFVNSDYTNVSLQSEDWNRIKNKPVDLLSVAIINEDGKILVSKTSYMKLAALNTLSGKESILLTLDSIDKEDIRGLQLVVFIVHDSISNQYKLESNRYYIDNGFYKRIIQINNMFLQVQEN